jgi:hypothetical protein
MATLEELAEKKAAIEAEMEQLKKDKRDEDLKTVKELCKLHGFTAGMLKGALAPGRKPKSK